MTYLQLAQIIGKNTAAQHGAPSDVAVVCGGLAYTYADLEARSTRLARYLSDVAGVVAGDRVLVLMENRIEWFDMFFAAAKLQAVIVPANPLLVPAELEHIVADAAVSAVVSENALAAKLSFLTASDRFATKLILVDGAQPHWLSLPDDNPALDDAVRAGEVESVSFPAADPAAPFLLQYTSGTTGRPKAAIHTQSTVLMNTLNQVAEYSVTHRDRYLILASFAWIAGFHAFTLPTLLAGGSVVVHPSTSFGPDEVCTAIAADGVTIATFVPTVIRKLIESPRFNAEDLDRLRLIVAGAAPVAADLMETMTERLPHCDVMQAFGMSELPTSVTVLRREEAALRPASIGKASLLTQIRVVDSIGNDVPAGEVGEVLTRSPCTAAGYWNRAEQTAEAFAGDWFHTGDLARIDEAGFLFVAGRSKELIVSGGLNIYPAEIEEALDQHPRVAEAAVLGIPDERWGETPVAVIVTSAELDVDDLKSFAAERLARFKLPSRWVLRSEPLPRTLSGKVKKADVAQALAMNRELS